MDGLPAPAKKIPRGGKVDRVVDQLRAGIANQHYAPGQRLIEADLTRAYNVGRSSLREAFSRLAAEGLLEIVPNRGALVRRLSLRETVELFQIRTAHEALAVRLAAQAVANADRRARFEAATAEIWSDTPRAHGLHYHDENLRFHQAILDICGNGRLAELSRQLRLPLILLQLSNEMTPEMYLQSVHEHRTIATAILDCDPDAAEAAMRAHLSRAAEIAGSMPASVFSG